MAKITITRALKELKLLDSRIQKTIKSITFIDIYQGRNPQTTLFSKMNKNEFETKVKSKVQSINDLIKLRNEMKSKVLISNSSVKVKINNKEYLVVEAIDRKEAILYEKLFLQHLKGNYEVIKRKIEENKASLENKINSMIEASLGTEKNIDKETYSQIANPVYEANEFKMINPIKIEKKIEELEKEIDLFENEVDFVLSESNSRTEIEIDLISI